MNTIQQLKEKFANAKIFVTHFRNIGGCFYPMSFLRAHYLTHCIHEKGGGVRVKIKDGPKVLMGFSYCKEDDAFNTASGTECAIKNLLREDDGSVLAKRIAKKRLLKRVPEQFRFLLDETYKPPVTE